MAGRYSCAKKISNASPASSFTENSTCRSITVASFLVPARLSLPLPTDGHALAEPLGAVRDPGEIPLIQEPLAHELTPDPHELGASPDEVGRVLEGDPADGDDPHLRERRLWAHLHQDGPGAAPAGADRR